MTEKTLGYGKCMQCGADVAVRVNKKGHLYAYCQPPSDGGCGVGPQNRYAHGDTLMARSITKWTNPADRAAYLGDDALPAKAKPKPEPAPIAAHTAPIVKPKPAGFWDREI